MNIALTGRGFQSQAPGVYCYTCFVAINRPRREHRGDLGTLLLPQTLADDTKVECDSRELSHSLAEKIVSGLAKPNPESPIFRNSNGVPLAKELILYRLT
ncbi:MAG: hypothetical protein Aurels2KO_30260 [Aureliella sp.]